MSQPRTMLYQSAALPIRDGQLCMVTSSSGKRWVIPKGCHEPGKTSGEIAIQEAWEEAGLVGLLKPEPVGSYLYTKWGTVCHVTVFVLEVTEEATEWPEMSQRQREWLKPRQAIERLDEAGLRLLVKALLVRKKTRAKP